MNKVNKYFFIYAIIAHQFIYSESKGNIDLLSIQLDSLKQQKRTHVEELEKVNSKIDSLENLIEYHKTNKNKNRIYIVSEYNDYGYSEKSLMSQKMFPIKKDERIEVIDVLDIWYKIKKDNKIGFGRKIDFFVNYEDGKLLDKIKQRNEDEFVNKLANKYKYILIKSIKIDGPNSANGVGVTINLFNLCDKVIKYIYIYADAYNEVGDKVKCQIKRTSKASLKITGPLNKSPSNDINSSPFKTFYSWENLWYNSTISCVKFTKIKIKFIDGSEYVLIKELPNVFYENVSNNCSYKMKK